MTTTDIVIRDCTEADMPSVTAVYAQSVREETASFELVPPDLMEMTRRRAGIVEKGHPYLVAELEGEVAGYAYASAFHPRPAYALTVENTVYVARAAQRQGVGRALMTALIEACTARGYRQMIAIVGGSDHLASIALHKALGFNQVGVFKSVGYKHGRWLDAVYLQRPLGAGDTTPPDGPLGN
jgi:phosphinothricin acetyltransferase